MADLSDTVLIINQRLELMLVRMSLQKKSTLYSRKEPSIRSKFSLPIHDQSVFKI